MLHNLLQSDFVPCFHPLKSYLDTLPRWDGKTDFIGNLAAMVHCKCCDSTTFADYFRRNRSFEEENTARNLILAYYRKPAEGERGKYLNTAQIMLRFGGGIKLHANQLARVLKELEFENAHLHNGRFWLLMERSQEEMAQTLPEPIEDETVKTTDDTSMP